MLILVIDDHPLYRDALGRLLPQIFAGATVEQASDWSVASVLLTHNAGFDLVLLDLDMPGTHGRRALSSLRQSFAHLKVVVVSASEDAEEARRCLAEGACGFISKSARTEVLGAALRLVHEGGVYLPPLLLDVSHRVVTTSAPHAEQLTPRETEILALLCAGLSNKAIAKALHIAEATVRAHLSSVFRTLGVVNRTQAARVARQRGLVPDQ